MGAPALMAAMIVVQKVTRTTDCALLGVGDSRGERTRQEWGSGGQGQLQQLPRMAASHWPVSVSPRVCSRGQERRSA